ncbi:Transcriptional regulator [Elasticomyces elasticus]|nr:Transcriptional regulator [Elasticomyces elasticus]
MAPPAASKSKQKQSQASTTRRSRSRNSTPVASTEPSAQSSQAFSATAGTSAYLHTPLATLLVPQNTSIESIFERYCKPGVDPPPASVLESIHDAVLNQVLSHVKNRGDACDGRMRELARKRKERGDADRDREAAEEKRASERERKKELSKTGARSEREEDAARPPAVGAHGVARQDGVDLHKDGPSSSPLAKVRRKSSATSAADSPTSPESITSHQPRPVPPVNHYETFGPDPSTFPDSTIYDIRPLTPDMTEEEKKAILCVASYPHSDLRELTCGTPPDVDLSNAKPPNQVQFNTFMTYIEPYTRPLTEEDVAFLKERGDNLAPYLIPPRGKEHYKEIWAREDGNAAHESNMQTDSTEVEAKGAIDMMSDDIAETDEVSTGPLLARLNAALMAVPPTNNTPNETHHTNGDVTMTNGDTTAGEAEDHGPGTSSDDAQHRPATHLPFLDTKFTLQAPTLDYPTLEDRLKQELNHLGILTPEAEPDYTGHADDPIAARLRHLQSLLRTVSRTNGARKARILDLTLERLASQEYSSIADDLDTQVNTAYLKRRSGASRPKKSAASKSGGRNVATAVGARGVGEGVKALMERREGWRGLIGPVVGFGRGGVPRDSVFGKDLMESLEAREEELAEVGAGVEEI